MYCSFGASFSGIGFLYLRSLRDTVSLLLDVQLLLFFKKLYSKHTYLLACMFEF